MPNGVQYDFLQEGDKLFVTDPTMYDASTMDLRYFDPTSPSQALRRAVLLARLANDRWQISLASVRRNQVPLFDPFKGFETSSYAAVAKSDTVLVYGYKNPSAADVMKMYLTIENKCLCLKDRQANTISENASSATTTMLDINNSAIERMTLSGDLVLSSTSGLVTSGGKEVIRNSNDVVSIGAQGGNIKLAGNALEIETNG
eukprot:gene19536-26216_t